MPNRKPPHGKPEVDDGYLRIANELHLALCRLKCPPNARQVIDGIIHHTYGAIPSKKMMKYDLGVLAETTGLKKPVICRAIKALIMRDYVIMHDNGKHREIGIQKVYGRWQSLSRMITVITHDYKGGDPTIYRKTKDSSCEEDKFADNSNEIRLAKYLWGWLQKNKIQRPKPPNLQTWAGEFDRILRIDKHPVEEVRKIIKWAQTDSFWIANMQSPQTLRKQYAKLEAKMRMPPSSGKKEIPHPLEYFDK